MKKIYLILLLSCFMFMALMPKSVMGLDVNVSNWSELVDAYNNYVIGDVIKLSADIISTSDLEMSPDTVVPIDLNGYRLTIEHKVTFGANLEVTGTAIGDNTIDINAGGELNHYGTINKTSDFAAVIVHGGKLNVRPGCEINAVDFAIEASGGIVNIYGGKFTSSSNYGITVRAAGSSELFVVGGEIIATGANAKGILGQDNGEVNISDGIVDTTSGSGSTSVEMANDSVFYMNGGEVKSGGYAIAFYGDNCSGSISGGTITADVAGVFVDRGTVEVSGGTIQGNTGTKGILMINDSHVTINNGANINCTGIDSNGVQIANGGGELIVNGGSIRGAYGIYGDDDFTINGGNIEGYVNECLMVIGSTAEINNGTMTGNVNGVRNYGTLTINGGTIEGNNVGIINDINGRLTVNDGNILGENSGIIQPDTGAIANIYGGSITATLNNNGMLNGIGFDIREGDLTVYGGTLQGPENGISIGSNVNNVILYYGSIKSTGGDTTDNSIFRENETPRLVIYSDVILNTFTDGNDDIVTNGNGNFFERQSFSLLPTTINLINGVSSTVNFTVTGEDLDGNVLSLSDLLSDGSTANTGYTVSGNSITFNPTSSGNSTITIIDNITYSLNKKISLSVANGSSGGGTGGSSGGSRVYDTGTLIEHKPSLKSVELMEDGKVKLTTETPHTSIIKLNKISGEHVFTNVWIKTDGHDWEELTNCNTLEEIFSTDANGRVKDIKSFEVKIRYGFDNKNYPESGKKNTIFSPFSNVITVENKEYTNEPPYQGASEWAIEELDKASELGLITDRIKNNISDKITREEFAEIAVRFYEAYVGEKTTVGNATFIDTSNPEILKAKNLGLVTGIGNGQYSPHTLITREEMATIILRILQVIKPDADFNLYSPQRFSDDSNIDDWAKSGVYYCAETGIVIGMGNGNFEPYCDTTREQAVVACLRAYDYFKRYESYLVQ